MAIKKSELYSAIWQSCGELRGCMDSSHKNEDEENFTQGKRGAFANASKEKIGYLIRFL
jgi:hypothetical protein